MARSVKAGARRLRFWNSEWGQKIKATQLAQKRKQETRGGRNVDEMTQKGFSWAPAAPLQRGKWVRHAELHDEMTQRGFSWDRRQRAWIHYTKA